MYHTVFVSVVWRYILLHEVYKLTREMYMKLYRTILEYIQLQIVLNNNIILFQLNVYGGYLEITLHISISLN